MTLFKDIRNGYPVHVLTRSEEDGTIEYLPCNVVNVAPPYFPTSQYANGHLPQPPIPFTPNTQNTYNRVMDITIQVKEKTTTYTVGENSCLSEAPGGILIATDRDLIIKELENIKSQNTHKLSKVPILENEILCCDSILESIDPSVSEKKAMDSRLQKLEKGYSDMSGNIERILGILQRNNGGK